MPLDPQVADLIMPAKVSTQSAAVLKQLPQKTAILRGFAALSPYRH